MFAYMKSTKKIKKFYGVVERMYNYWVLFILPQFANISNYTANMNFLINLSG